jgi:hypothetical protein
MSDSDNERMVPDTTDEPRSAPAADHTTIGGIHCNWTQGEGGAFCVTGRATAAPVEGRPWCV